MDSGSVCEGSNPPAPTPKDQIIWLLFMYQAFVEAIEFESDPGMCF